MNSTFEKLSAILQKDYAVAPEQLSMDSPLEGLGIDSLGVIELMFTVEDEFGLQLPGDPQPLHSVGEVVRFIDELLILQGPAPNESLAAM